MALRCLVPGTRALPSSPATDPRPSARAGLAARRAPQNASRTFDEIAADLAAAEEAADGDSGARDADDMPDDDDEAPVYNPKNLPLGWDGKPIPYWLYKLHGLNLEFKCEICGGVSYW